MRHSLLALVVSFSGAALILATIFCMGCQSIDEGIPAVSWLTGNDARLSLIETERGTVHITNNGGTVHIGGDLGNATEAGKTFEDALKATVAKGDATVTEAPETFIESGT